MTDDTTPQDDPRPLTQDELYARAADWSDYRKNYGVSPNRDTLRREHAAFCHAWHVEHVRRDALATSAQNTESAELARSAIEQFNLVAPTSEHADLIAEGQHWSRPPAPPKGEVVDAGLFYDLVSRLTAALASTPSPAQPTEADNERVARLMAIVTPLGYSAALGLLEAEAGLLRAAALVPSPVQGADDRLAQIAARVEAATPGPWVIGNTPTEVRGAHDSAIQRPWVADVGNSEADAVLIAHAPADLAYLLRLATYQQSPQAAPDPRDVAHMECNCVPADGPPHCHKCGEQAGHPVAWAQSYHGELLSSEQVTFAVLNVGGALNAERAIALAQQDPEAYADACDATDEALAALAKVAGR